MTAWLTSLRDRPIAESERAAAMAAVTVLLLAAALLLALSRPSNGPRPTPQRHPGPSIAQRTPIRPAQTPESSTAPLRSSLRARRTCSLPGTSGTYTGTPRRARSAAPRPRCCARCERNRRESRQGCAPAGRT